MSQEAPEFTPYAVGMCSASVCTSLPADQVAARLNQEYPTGIDSKWALSEEPTFAQGAPNPCTCPDHPETHKHYLLHC